MNTSILFLSFFYVANASHVNRDIEIQQTFKALEKIVGFLDNHYGEMNFDGLLGITIGEACLLEITENPSLNPITRTKVNELYDQIQNIGGKIRNVLPEHPEKVLLLQRYLLDPNLWKFNTTFRERGLIDLGSYVTWLGQKILEEKSAVYKGTPTDVCLVELLSQSMKKCKLSSLCQEMMFAVRDDTGYLLSHRLLFVQISRSTACSLETTTLEMLTSIYCSLMLKEAKTNERLEFPAHDIFIEQVVLCGLEGYVEFLNTLWRRKILEWQTQYGCYKDQSEEGLSKRTANVISYGCSDHTTGLAFASLTLQLQYLLSKEGTT